MKKLNLSPEDMKRRRMLQIKKSNIKNKEKQKAHKLKRKLENPEEFKKQRRASYLRNKEHVKQKAKENYYLNREKRLQYAKSRHLEPGFKETKALYGKEWRKKNRTYQNQKIKEKYYTDINLKIKANLSNRIRNLLKNSNVAKTNSTEELVGCSVSFLKEYLTAKFTDGMSWNNHTIHGWHIDHIIPCASFDLTDVSQQKKCFHYTNLQPLWGYENTSKQDLSLDEWNDLKQRHA